MLNLCLVLLSLSAEAKVFEGVVHVNANGQYSINLDDDGTETRIPLFGTSSTVTTDIRKLLSSDILMGKGTIYKDAVYIDAVDFAQLQNIKGTWENKTDAITVNIYTVSYLEITKGKGSKKQTTSYVYALAPNEKTKWTIFIYQAPTTPESKIIPGVVTFNNLINSKILRLVIYDPDTQRVQLQSTLLRK